MYRIAFIVLILISVLTFSHRSEAQSMVMTSNYDTVAPGDTLVWTFKMDGATKSYSKLVIDAVDGFRQLSMLDQKETTKHRQGKDGKVTTIESTTSISFLMLAEKEGRYLAGSANILWEGNTVVHSKPVWITVRKGQINRPKPYQRNKVPDFFRPNMQHFPHEEINILLLEDKLATLQSVAQPYLIIAGWLTTDSTLKASEFSVMQTVNKQILQVKGIKRVDSFYNAIAPRRYYYIATDTIGLSASIQTLSRKLPERGGLIVVTTKPKDWNVMEETYAFDYELMRRHLIHQFKQQKLFIDAQKQKKKLPLELTFGFIDLKQMETFRIKAIQLGYTATEMDTTITQTHQLYTASFIKTVPADLRKIDEIITVLVKEGKLPESRAVYIGIGINKDL